MKILVALKILERHFLTAFLHWVIEGEKTKEVGYETIENLW